MGIWWQSSVVCRAGKIKGEWPRLVLGLFLLSFVWYGFLMIRVNAYAALRDASSADAAIVMGAAVWGSRPSPVFAERIKHSINLYQEGQVQAIIFTGGLGRGDQLTEAEAAKVYAVARGVPAERIFLDTVSTVTYENLEQAAKIVEQQGFSRVLVVSDPIHMKRSVTTARDLGLDAHPSPTPSTRYKSLWSKFGFLVRETGWYAGYLLRQFVLLCAAHALGNILYALKVNSSIVNVLSL